MLLIFIKCNHLILHTKSNAVLPSAVGQGPLWRAGVSQPPFLMALAGKYEDIGAQFNVRGLGRGDIAPEEVRDLTGSACELQVVMLAAVLHDVL